MFSLRIFNYQSHSINFLPSSKAINYLKIFYGAKNRKPNILSKSFGGSFYEFYQKYDSKLVPKKQGENKSLQEQQAQKVFLAIKDNKQYFALKNVQILTAINRLRLYQIKVEQGNQKQLKKRLQEINQRLYNQALNQPLAINIMEKFIDFMNYYVNNSQDQKKVKVMREKFQQWVVENQKEQCKVTQRAYFKYILEPAFGNQGQIYFKLSPKVKQIIINTILKEKDDDLQNFLKENPHQQSQSLAKNKQNFAFLKLIENLLQKNLALNLQFNHLQLIVTELNKHKECLIINKLSIKFLAQIFTIKQGYNKFNPQNKLKLQALFKNILSSNHLNLIFFYLATLNEYNISSLFNITIFMPFQQRSKFQLFLLCSITSDLNEYDQSFIDNQASLKNIFIKRYLTDIHNHFKMFQELQVYQIPYYHVYFHKAFHLHFKTFSNIYQIQLNKKYIANHQNAQLMALFVYYFLKTHHFTDKKIFIRRYFHQITDDIFSQALIMHLNDNKLYPDQYYNKILLYKFTSHKGKSLKILKLGLQYIDKYKIYVIQRDLKEYTEFIQIKLWKLLQLCVQNIQLIIDHDLVKVFNSIINYLMQKMSSSNHYKTDSYYSSLVLKIIGQLDLFMQINPFRSIQIIQYALEANLLQQQYVKDNMELFLSFKLESHILLKIKTIAKEKIQIVEINKDTIQSFFMNDIYQDMIFKLKEQILEIISQVQIKKLLSYLSIFNLDNNIKENKEIHECILDNITKKIKKQDIKIINICTIFRNCLKRLEFHLKGYYFLAEFIINNNKELIQKLSIEAHRYLLMYFSTLKQSKITKKILQNYVKILLQIISDQKLYLHSKLVLMEAIARTNYSFNQDQFDQLRSFTHSKGIIYCFNEILSILVLVDFDQKYWQNKLMNFARQIKNIKSQIQFSDLLILYYQTFYPETWRQFEIKNLVITKEQLSSNHPLIYQRVIKKMQEILNNKSQKIYFINKSNILIRINQTLMFFLSPKINRCQRLLTLLKRLLLKHFITSNYEVVFIRYYSDEAYENDFLSSLKENSSLLNQEQMQEISNYFQTAKKLNILALEGGKDFDFMQEEESDQGILVNKMLKLQEEESEDLQQQLQMFQK